MTFVWSVFYFLLTELKWSLCRSPKEKTVMCYGSVSQTKTKKREKNKIGCMSDAQFLVISFDRTKLFCFVGYMCD